MFVISVPIVVPWAASPWTVIPSGRASSSVVVSVVPTVVVSVVSAAIASVVASVAVTSVVVAVVTSVTAAVTSVPVSAVVVSVARRVAFPVAKARRVGLEAHVLARSRLVRLGRHAVGDTDVAAVQFDAVELLDALLGLFLGCHRDESESTGSLGLCSVDDAMRDPSE